MLTLLFLACTSENTIGSTVGSTGGGDSGDGGCDSGDPAEPGACDDFSPPAFEDPAVDKACEADRSEVPLDARVKWAWTGGDNGFDQVGVTPVVAPLADDTGTVSPAVVFTAYHHPDYGDDKPGVLVVLSGDDGQERLNLTDIRDASGAFVDEIPAQGGVALGDVDGDGLADICVAGGTVPVHCLSSTGDLIWSANATNTSDLEVRRRGYPLIADLDADGQPEVVHGRQIFDGSSGLLLASGTSGWGGLSGFSHYAMPITARLGSGNALSVIGGNAAYAWDGTALTTTFFTGVPDGFAAVADLDRQNNTSAEDRPEIVVISDGQLYTIEHDGTVAQSVALTEAGIRGGSPTIADFTGGGSAEIGVAGQDEYVTYAPDGTVVWDQDEVWDFSNMTGSSVFDFDGDGLAEVVYADGEQLYILDGATGANRLLKSADFDPTAYSSSTAHEYPTLADLDEDGSTEIILGSNQYFNASGWAGVRAIGSKTAAWMPSRPVWNQHAYSITNVNDDGTIPQVQADNWATFNNFRAQEQSRQPVDWLADLSPVLIDYCADCDADEITVYVVVENSGLADADPFLLELYDDGTLVASQSMIGLDSGSSLLAGPYTLSAADWTGTLSVVLDGDDAIEECEEGNNTLSGDAAPCE